MRKMEPEKLHACRHEKHCVAEMTEKCAINVYSDRCVINTSTHYAPESSLCERTIVIRHERHIGAYSVVDVLQNIVIIEE